MTLPAVTEMMTICFSRILRIAAKPETNAVRRSDPSPNVLIFPVSLKIIVACSSAWHDELPAGAENPDAQGVQTEAPETAVKVPGKHGVQDSFFEPPLENDAAGQLPEGANRPGELQCLPGEHGVQLDDEAFPEEKDPKGQSPLNVVSP